MNDYGFGNRIYELRTAKGLSQRELGKLVGVSNKAVSKWETGAAKPRAEKLAKLSEVFGVPLGALFSSDPDGAGGESPAGARDGEISFAIGLLSREMKRTKHFLLASVVCYFAAPLFMLLFVAVGPFSGNEINGVAAALLLGLFFLHVLAEAAVIVFFILFIKRKRILYASFPQRKEEIARLTNTLPPAKKTGRLGLIVFGGVMLMILAALSVLFALHLVEGSFVGWAVSLGALAFGIFHFVFIKIKMKKIQNALDRGKFDRAISGAKFLLEVWLPDGRSPLSEGLRLRIALASFALHDDENFLEYLDEIAADSFLPAKSYCRCLYFLANGDKEGFFREYREGFLPLQERREKKIRDTVAFYGEPLALFFELAKNGDENAREKLFKTVRNPRTKEIAGRL